MLKMYEARCHHNLATVFVADTGSEAISEVLPSIHETLCNRFRCGEKPSESRSPLIGKIAFIKSSDGPLHPAAITTLTHELFSLFEVICVQVSPRDYMVAAVNRASTGGYQIGDSIPMADVKEHENPWSRAA